MARRVFYSFHYIPDAWRVSQVRNIGTVEDNKPASDNDWESIKKGGDAEIKKWISGQMSGRSCTIVMIGENTANRKWINFEIDKAWTDGKGVLGIHIHKLKNSSSNQSSKGLNPFDYCTIPGTATKLSTKIKVYDPPGTDSKAAYEHIAANIEAWIDAAVASRT
jgi:hypothetical protein